MKYFLFICALLGVGLVQANVDQEKEVELYENQNELLKEIKQNFMGEINYVKEIKNFMNQTCYEDNQYIEFVARQIYKQIHKYSDSIDTSPNISLCSSALRLAEVDLLHNVNKMQTNLNTNFKETYQQLSTELRSYKKSKKEALKIIRGEEISEKEVESIKLSDLINNRKIPKEKTKWKKFIYETMFFFKHSVKLLQQFVVNYIENSPQKNIIFLQDLKKHLAVHFNLNCENGKYFEPQKSNKISYENQALLEQRIGNIISKEIKMIGKLNDSVVEAFNDYKKFIDFRMKLIMERAGHWFSRVDVKDLNQCTASLQGVTAFITGKNSSIYKNLITRCLDGFLDETNNMVLELQRYAEGPLNLAKERLLETSQAMWNESLYLVEYEMNRKNIITFLQFELNYRNCVDNIIEGSVVKSSEEIEKSAVENCVDKKLYANSTLADFIESQSIY